MAHINSTAKPKINGTQHIPTDPNLTALTFHKLTHCDTTRPNATQPPQLNTTQQTLTQLNVTQHT